MGRHVETSGMTEQGKRCEEDVLVDGIAPLPTYHHAPCILRIVRAARPVTRDGGPRCMRLGVGVTECQVGMLVQHPDGSAPR
jgi:hypothetical protein